MHIQIYVCIFQSKYIDLTSKTYSNSHSHIHTHIHTYIHHNAKIISLKIGLPNFSSLFQCTSDIDLKKNIFWPFYIHRWYGYRKHLFFRPFLKHWWHGFAKMAFFWPFSLHWWHGFGKHAFSHLFLCYCDLDLELCIFTTFFSALVTGIYQIDFFQPFFMNW